MTYGWTSPLVPYFLSNETHIEITESDGNWLENLTLVGAVFCLPITVFAVDYFGRKSSLILSSLVGCICWIMLLVAENVTVMFIARFFAGMVGDMCAVAAPMYVAEISDYRIRGFLASMIYLQMLLGILIVYCTGSLTPYIVTPIVGIVLTSAQCILFPFMPESPYYYVSKNQHEKARRAIKRVNFYADIDQEIANIQDEITAEKENRGSLMDLIRNPTNRLAMTIMIVLNGGQHFVGISVIMMNVQLILEEAGSVYMSSTSSAILFAVTMLVSATIASLFIDKFGRRVLLMSSGILSGLALLILSVYFNLQYLDFDITSYSWLPIVCVMIYAATFKIGLGLVPVVVTAEIFPPNCKAIGITLADVIYMLAALASINLYTLLYNSFGMYAPFYVFSVSSFMIALYTYIWIPETKGKTLEEIQFILEARTTKRK
ncbi:hypothetical protein GWI33_012597 [Rhynchophorus ferrugineus]|uniref:Major facilitator superfamily (MFS) profile domain-containing protein n=1 Tax=Rhynchophorus ferrugineus TaxID=354439 RepID=A0A834IB33_RHYFE|nr:hypothetical protein GWI33_012597 [Rhynchophorus ferrugineus]